MGDELTDAEPHASTALRLAFAEPSQLGCPENDPLRVRKVGASLWREVHARRPGNNEKHGQSVNNLRQTAQVPRALNDTVPDP
jgi:hypothetical protein